MEKRKKERAIKKGIVVIYHANCSDGFGGAYSAWKKFGDRAEYIAARHSVPPPAGLKNKEIYTIDYVYPEQHTRKLIRENKRVTAIDHHVSAKEVTELTEKYSYALHHSGAVLAWQYFHPGKKVPRLLRHIEDMDLWKFRLPHTKQIFSYLDIFDFNFQVWDDIVRDFENPAKRKKILAEGALVLQHEERLVGRLVANNTQLVSFEGHKTLAVNSPLFQSEAGAILYKTLPPMAIIWHYDKDRIKISLRSDNSVDVSKIAGKYGGGGHRGSASFVLPFGSKLPWKIL